MQSSVRDSVYRMIHEVVKIGTGGGRYSDGDLKYTDIVRLKPQRCNTPISYTKIELRSSYL